MSSFFTGQNTSSPVSASGSNPFPGIKPVAPVATAPDPYQDEINRQNALAELQFALSHGLGEAQLHFQIADADRNFGLALQQINDEKIRQSRIRQAVAQIQNTFTTRTPVYKKLEDASFSLNKDKLTDQRADARRSLRFALARSGLDGGSVDVDKGKDINDRWNDGLIQAREYAQGVYSNARQSDEALKNSLLNTALSGGGDGSTLLSGTQGALQSIANKSPSLSPVFAAGNYFAGTDAVGGFQQALQPFQKRTTVSVSSPNQGYGGTVT